VKDYSQSGEQAAILAAFESPHGPEGVFLDIGAYHPFDKSNTRALCELGWSGIMIEPSPGPMKALLAEYGNEPRITLIQACVTLEPGLVSLKVSDDAVSSSNAAVQETWKEAGGYFGSMLVPGLTLEALSNQFGGAFDFVNIDAEGCSIDIALRMLSLGWEPKCFCCETDGRLEELMIAATAKNFRLTFANGCNAVLVRG
jgi:FkbM family methyltransferase